MNIKKVKIIKKYKNFIIIKDERKTAIVLKSDINKSGEFRKYIINYRGIGRKGFQYFDFNTGYNFLINRNFGHNLKDAIRNLSRTYY